MSRARLERSGNGKQRHGALVAVPLLPHERALLQRALAELVAREGASQATEDVQRMLEAAAPADVFAELEGERVALPSPSSYKN